MKTLIHLDVHLSENRSFSLQCEHYTLRVNSSRNQSPIKSPKHLKYVLTKHWQPSCSQNGVKIKGVLTTRWCYPRLPIDTNTGKQVPDFDNVPAFDQLSMARTRSRHKVSFVQKLIVINYQVIIVCVLIENLVMQQPAKYGKIVFLLQHLFSL